MPWMKPGASNAMSKSSAATCRCCHAPAHAFAFRARLTYQPSGTRSAVGQGAGGNEHKVVGVRVAVEAAAAKIANRVLIRAPVDASVVHEASVRGTLQLRGAVRALTCRVYKCQRQRRGEKTSRQGGCGREECARRRRQGRRSSAPTAGATSSACPAGLEGSLDW
jgi:hypothetical protein